MLLQGDTCHSSRLHFIDTSHIESSILQHAYSAARNLQIATANNYLSVSICPEIIII